MSDKYDLAADIQTPIGRPLTIEHLEAKLDLTYNWGYEKSRQDLRDVTALPLGLDGLPLPEAPDKTPEAGQYLVCVAERDLSTLLPLLPQPPQCRYEVRPSVKPIPLRRYCLSLRRQARSRQTIRREFRGAHRRY